MYLGGQEEGCRHRPEDCVGEDDAELSPIPTTKKPPPKPLYLDVHDVGVIAYYNEDGVDYGCGDAHEWCARQGRLSDEAQGGWQWQGHLLEACCPPSLLCEGAPQVGHIMEAAYSNSHHPHCVITYNSVAQQIAKEMVIPDAAGQFWGEAQVIHLKFWCTSTPKITQQVQYQYPT